MGKSGTMMTDGLVSGTNPRVQKHSLGDISMTGRFNGHSAALAIAALLISTQAYAQADAVHRVPQQEQAYPAGYHSLTVKTTVDHGGTVLPHTHPGIEMSYLLEGEGTLKIAGQPDRMMKAGDSFAIPAAAVHSLVNTGPGAIVMVTTYVLEKDKPLATPVP
jgi:quercetin dioxygenase-like cupin family protein